MTSTPRSTTAIARPLPECDYLDEPVLGDPARDWATLVLDTLFALPEDTVVHTGHGPDTTIGTEKRAAQGDWL